MDNKDRDKLSRNTTPTSAGNVNRSTSERMSHEKSANSAEFGNKIGRSEDLENEPSRRSGSNSNSSSSGSVSSDNSGSSRSSSDSDWQSSGSSRSGGSSSGYNDSDRSGSSSGRH